MKTIKEFYRRRLPHWQPAGADFFITFRLSGSVPMTILRQWKAEKERLEAESDGDPVVLRHIRKIAFGKMDSFLDAATNGPYWLQEREIAQEIVNALRFHEGRSYVLHAYAIMPNHVHMLISHLPEAKQLYEILQSLKRYSAVQANRLLSRVGQQFWEYESYDHVVRNEAEFWRIYWYILLNPQKAGLVADWRLHPWTYGKYERL